MKKTYKFYLEHAMKLNRLTSAEKEQIERKYNLSVKEETEKILRNFCKIDKLRYSDMKTLQKLIKTMNEQEIMLIEEVNQKPINEIQMFLETELKPYDEEREKIRKFNAMWKQRHQELLQELIDEEVITKEEMGTLQFSGTNLHVYLKRVDMAKKELAKELGL